ncbi:MAG: ABC transporter ATP-binding protein [Ahrensia sp.]|nr:ABC transporter ATP-binding protein [Ahrensia sp.]
MINFTIWKKAWALLDRREQRNAGIVLAVVVLSALSSAVMIGSVMPFLSVLAEPNRIHEVRALAWAYEVGGFESNYSFLVALGLVSLVVIVSANLLQVARIWIVTRYITMRIHSLSYRLLAAYLNQPYEFFLSRHSGEMSTQILAETQQVVVQFLTPAAEAIASFLTIVVIVILLVWIDPIVALASFILLGGIYGGIFLISRQLVRRKGEIRAEANIFRYRIANEALGGVKDIKLLGRESAYVLRYEYPSQRMARADVFANVLSQLPQNLMQAVAFGGMIILCLLLVDSEGLASGQALGGILPLLGVFAFAGQRMMPELSRLYQGLTRLQYGSAAVESVYRDLALENSARPLPEMTPSAIRLQREIRLDRVSYRYPSADSPGLCKISLNIRAGEKIGIIGGSGAGKTTLADLILGLLRPTEGVFYVDGIAINEGNVRAWQQSVGYVPQDIFLTDSNIAENIALGIAPEEIDHSRVVEAARIAHLDGFIRKELPQGYETTVGERGVRLSGGQRQRIGIARAMYHDADLLVFDEATSALDNITEREVMAAIDGLPGGKTALIIAHRLTTVQRCDRILLLDQGRVAGFDSWDGLAEANEAFRRIANA